jgi:outer membrane protein assembly factor BamB
MLVALSLAGTLSLGQATLLAMDDVPAPAIEGARRALGQAQIKAAPVAVPAPPNDPNHKTGMTDAVTFPTDRKAKRSIEKAQDLIQEGAWGEAANLLQKLLDTPEDIFIEVERMEGAHWTSLHLEANRLISTMPAQGRQFYELQFGARARARLAEAKAQSNPYLLAEVAKRYMHTDAGFEATSLLATHLLDRGRFVMAALCFERLLNNTEKADKLPPMTLFKAAFAFRLAGENIKAGEVWNRLARVARDGLRLGDRTVSLDQLRKELDQYGSDDSPASTWDWALFKGNASRSAQGKGGTPFLESKWLYTTINANPEPGAKDKQAEQWLDRAIKQQESRGPVLPAFFPIAVTLQRDAGPVPLLIYRSYWGVHARNLLKDGKLEWESALDGGLDRIVVDPEKKMQLSQWIELYLSNSPHMLFENSVVGTLSTDNKRVYAVDDLALPPHPMSQPMQQMMWGQQANFGKLNDMVHHSKLFAFDLQTNGKLVWELGGRGDKSELGDSYFLGPPLPVGDKLYLLADKNSELRLICLDPSRDDKAPPAISWIQTLVNVRDKMLTDVGRRMQAGHLSYGEGVLVCPTNAGIVLGVDILSHTLVWAHSYREDSPPRDDYKQMLGARPMWVNGHNMNATLNTDWKTSAPIVIDGKVVFTAPDAASVHCLNLRNGELLWKERRDNDLYLAGVYNGKVLLVGRSACRAVNLADGKVAWRVETGTPSGQGVASDGLYFLPLKAGAQSKKPEVCTIDINRGLVLPPNESRKQEVPGNLLFYEGDVISQTASQITAYRQLRIKLDETNLALSTNPLDPVGLTERGELKLAQGNLDGALEDLRKALANKPPEEVLPKTRSKLFETFTALFQHHFAENEKYLDEFKSLCDVSVPADATPEDKKKLEEEQQRRQADYLCLLAKGREKQGRLADAFDAYMDFGALSGGRNLVSVIDERAIKARPDVWAQGRIAAMLSEAKPERRRPLEEKIAAKWQDVKARRDVHELRGFVAVFGSLFTVGTEARMELAERLIDEKAFLEAEMHLLQVRRQGDRHLAARATEALARLMLRNNLLEDAAYWYRALAHEFGDTVVRGDKKGAEFLNDLATDKRLLAYLDEPRRAWADARLKAKEGPGNGSMPQIFVFTPEGEMVPFFRNHILTFQGGNQIKLVNRATNEDVAIPDLRSSTPGADVNFLFRGYQNVRYPYQLAGHLVVLNLGPVVYAIDPISRKKLWEQSLYSGVSPQNNNVRVEPDGTLQVIFPDGYTQRLGQTGPVTASYVCLNTRDGLMALDPLTGTTLWTKTDVPARTQLFGDDQYIYIVEMRSNNAAGTGRAVRAHDGVAVEVPDFGPLFQRRLRILGRHLLLSDSDPKTSELTVRLYDVHTGKDAWKRTFKPGAVVMRSEIPELLGVVEPADGGKVTVINLHTFKEVLSAHMDPKDLDKIQEVHLLEDSERYYIACQRTMDAGANPWGGPYPNVMNGMRCVHVNGKIYAFYRDTGKLHWKAEALGQMLVLDQFQDVPVLLFTATQRRPMNVGGNVRNGIQQVAVTRSIEKRTGKLLWDKEYPNQSLQFSALQTNLQAGTIDLLGYNLTLRHYLDNDSPARTEGSKTP